MRHTIKSPSTLFDFLKTLYPDSSNKTIKQVLENGRVILNGRVAKVGKLPLKPGYVVEIKKKELRPLNPALKLIYEDDDIIVIEKKEGLLTISTEEEKEKTAYSYLYDYVKGKDPRNRIFIVHRLDERTSGLLVFARNEKTKETLKNLFAAHKVERKYIAIVEGAPEKKVSTIRTYLAEGKNLKVYPTYNKEKGKLSVTHYKVIKETDKNAVLDVTLETGRRAQIRVQLAHIGHPIVGDVKYGAVTDPLKRLGLHAYRLSFIHPVTGKKMEFESKVPQSFDAIEGMA